MSGLEKHIKLNVISGRNLKAFESVLGFNRNELEGHKILNFGSGGSNIGKELESEGINCEVVDVDLLPNPHTVHDHDFSVDEYTLRRSTLERKVREHDEGQLLLKPVEEYENELLGIDGRNFVQLDESGKLDFPDKYFDDVFVSWVFHQIPDKEKENYLREFMRVSKKIYISPVGRSEIRIIEKSLLNSQFVIGSILPFGDKKGSQISTNNTREKGLTDDGYFIDDLDIDYSEKPHSVNASGCAQIVLKMR